MRAETQDGILHDVAGGLTCGIISIFFGLSFAAVTFSGPLKPWLPQGIAVTLISTAVAGIVFSARGSLRFAIAGPDSSTTAVIAALSASCAATLLRAGSDPSAIFEPVLFVIALSSGLTGLLLYVLGFAHAGRAIRFVPFPVIGGFLGASGWLMTAGALRVIADVHLSDALPSSLVEAVPKLAAAAAVALAIALQRQLVRNVLAIPLLLTAAIIGFHVVRFFTGASIDEAVTHGWTFPPTPSLVFPQTPLLSGHEPPWALIAELAGEILAVAVVTTLAMMFNTTGVELATGAEADLDRDLRALGLTNVASAFLGGFVSCISLSRSTINYATGARGRAGGFALAAVALIALFVGPSLLAYIPKFVLGGLLLFAGLDLTFNWLFASHRRLPFADFCSLVVIAVIIINWGFVAGVLIGIVIGCATFAVSASRVDAIKFRFDGTQYHSNLDRSVDELQILSQHGQELQAMSLHSYLFFGTTNRLYRHVKSLLASEPRCRFLIFDFRLVTGMDSSATQSFAQIKLVARAAGARVVMSAMSEQIEELMRMSGVLTQDVAVEPTLDRALEDCENAVIAGHRRDGLGSASLIDWLTRSLGSRDLAKSLIDLCTHHVVRAGEVIARQGDASNTMHFIVSGRVGIFVRQPEGEPVRVRSLGPLTTVGEMGLITGRSRTASIEAEVDTDYFELDETGFRALSSNDPKLCQALLTLIIETMSERLLFANRTIAVLRR